MRAQVLRRLPHPDGLEVLGWRNGHELPSNVLHGTDTDENSQGYSFCFRFQEVRRSSRGPEIRRADLLPETAVFSEAVGGRYQGRGRNVSPLPNEDMHQMQSLGARRCMPGERAGRSCEEGRVVQLPHL